MSVYFFNENRQLGENTIRLDKQQLSNLPHNLLNPKQTWPKNDPTKNETNQKPTRKNNYLKQLAPSTTNKEDKLPSNTKDTAWSIAMARRQECRGSWKPNNTSNKEKMPKALTS